jgi:hypothetical protein
MYKKIHLLLIAVMTILMGSSLSIATAHATEPFESYAVIDTVATMRIVSISTGTGSSFSGPNISGHAFLIISNDRSTAITVAGLSVPANGEVSVGTFGNKNNGNGVYLNVEEYYGGASYAGRVSLSLGLTASQLTTVNSTISSNNSWSATSDCSTFASRVWNSVSTTQLSAGTINTPAGLGTSIKSVSSYTTNTPMVGASKSNTYRLNLDGSRTLATGL